MPLNINQIESLLGPENKTLLTHTCKTIPKSKLHLPGSDYVERIMMDTDRNNQVLRNFNWLIHHGRLANTGYMSILPVDQGIEHSGGASFAPNPDYFDPENIVKLAIEGGCNAVASTFGVLGSVSRRYCHKIPFIVKFNHNELLSVPNKFDQVFFGKIDQAFEMGAIAVGATVYFGSEESTRQIQEVADAFQYAHELGMVTFLWCYLRNNAFKIDGTDYHTAADLTGQANHLGVTMQADVVKQKLPTIPDGYPAVEKSLGHSYGKYSKKMYEKLLSSNPIDMVRYQVANDYMGRVGLINSGGASGKNDLADVVATAVINKRAGGMGLITGRKAFQRPMKEGVELLHALQDVYLCNDIQVA